MSLEPTEIGADILYFVGDASGVAQLAGRTRFLDHLWLPCSLQQLGREQIAVINRFREDRMASDAQFSTAKFARGAIISLLSKISARAVIEIGCGKFPIASDIDLSSYVGVDIDQAAIDHCRRLGFWVGTLPEALSYRGLDKRADAIVAIYTFHFAVGSSLVEFISASLSETGILVFNMIVDDGVNAFRTIASFSERLCCFRVFKSSIFASKEFFVIMGRSIEAVTRGAAVFAAIVAEREGANSV